MDTATYIKTFVNEVEKSRRHSPLAIPKKRIFSDKFGEVALTAFAFLRCGVLSGLLAILLFAFCGCHFCQAISIFGFAIGISIASMAIGVLTGFLFGIPRTLQQDNVSIRAGETTRYLANTNLEQISDWLTKILVGVGLTQLTKIPGNLWHLAEKLSTGLGSFSGSAGFALTLMGVFCVTGFLYGYLWTRIYFRKVLIDAEKDTDRVSHRDLRTAMEKSNDLASAISTADMALAMSGDDLQAKQFAMREALKALAPHESDLYQRSVAIRWGRLHRWLGDYDDATECLTRALELRKFKCISGDQDDAALYYNRACYRNLKANQLSGKDANELRSEALNDLHECFKINDKDIDEALDDKDLKEVLEAAKNDPRFIAYFPKK